MKGKIALLGVAAAVFYAGGHGAAAVTTSASSPAGARAVAYAKAQLGRPYLWGGTGPGAFDCSGLAMMAWRSAGVDLDRTSQQQWASEPHIPAGREDPGDLVFFAGSDGTMTSPGHVGIVIGHGDMIEAYGTGYPIRVASYDRPDLVGFTDPAAQGSS